MIEIPRNPNSALALLLLFAACSGSGNVESAPAPVPIQDPSPAIQQQQPAASAEPSIPEPSAPPTVRGIDLDTVRAGEFDNGKMWTFEYPPLEYLEETYGLAPDSSWFERARLGALRLSNCSASFVSPNGLVLTNHHCARESVTKVARSGEELLDDGFYAQSLEDERVVEEFHADQLIAIVDVSDEVDAALVGAIGDEARAAARERIGEQITERMTAENGGEEAGAVVEVISLWNGARTSAYVFKRYTDIRLVMAPELQLGYFGGDPDNFTYPRYALDFSFFRVYEDGQPLEPDHYFRWSEEGVDEGDAVFIIGNPGSTSRLQTVAELEFRATVGDRAVVDLLRTRVEALQESYDEDPAAGDAIDLRNTIFSLLNSQKAYTGMLNGLQDPVLLQRRRDSERRFREAIEADPTLRMQYGDLLTRMAEIQSQKWDLAADYAAFVGIGSPDMTSAVLMRALFAFQYLSGRSGGAPSAALAGVEEAFRGVGSQTLGMQRRLLAARLNDFRLQFGDDSEVVTGILGGRAPGAAAQSIIAESVLADSAGAAQALGDGSLTMMDPAVQMITAFIRRFGTFQGAFFNLTTQEGAVASVLGQARFAVDGTSIPPDATFSLRIADGVVTGYDYNGTRAPVYTTFFGLYDHHHSYGAGTDWDLPDRWLNPPSSFDLSTPMNFVSTADIIGGNSGSPVLNADLELVGVVFDGNIESLPGDYIYVPDVNRAVTVDARGILEALDEIYDADRIVLELTTGQMASTEAEADAVRR